MTDVANVGVNLRPSGAGLERVAARAADDRRRVVGMDIGLHANLEIDVEVQRGNLTELGRKRQGDNKLPV
jgi:hypothetical protein